MHHQPVEHFIAAADWPVDSVPVFGDGVLSISPKTQKEKNTMPLDLPDGVGTVLLKTGTEAHIATMTNINNGSAHAAETLRTMSNLKLNEVGPIEARSAGRILDGPFPGSSKTT